jgi:hypothetical protein
MIPDGSKFGSVEVKTVFSLFLTLALGGSLSAQSLIDVGNSDDGLASAK